MDAFTLVLVLMLVVVVLLVAFAGRRADERTALRAVAAIAMLWAALSILAAIGAVAMPLISGSALELELLATSDSASSPTADGVIAIVPETQRAVVEPSALSAGAVAVILSGAAIAALVSATVAGVIAFGLRKLAAGDPFAPAMHRAALLAGSALALGLLISAGLTGFGRMIAADELNTLLAAEVFVRGFEVDLSPVALGIAVLGLAGIFRVGERLQRETAGLV